MLPFPREAAKYFPARLSLPWLILFRKKIIVSVSVQDKTPCDQDRFWIKGMKKENILYLFGVYNMHVYYLGNRDSNSSLQRNIYKPPDITLKFDRNKMMSLWREKLALLFFLFKVTLSSYDYYHFLSSYLFALSQTHLILKYGYCDFRSDQTNHHW